VGPRPRLGAGLGPGGADGLQRRRGRRTGGERRRRAPRREGRRLRERLGARAQEPAVGQQLVAQQAGPAPGLDQGA
jgi:hypothetical protein